MTSVDELMSALFKSAIQELKKTLINKSIRMIETTPPAAVL